MCQQCLAGFYPGDIECLQCVVGRYMDYSEDADTVATECKICGIGQYQDDVAKGTCKDIPPGMFELSIMYSVCLHVIFLLLIHDLSIPNILY